MPEPNAATTWRSPRAGGVLRYLVEATPREPDLVLAGVLAWAALAWCAITPEHRPMVAAAALGLALLTAPVARSQRFIVDPARRVVSLTTRWLGVPIWRRSRSFADGAAVGFRPDGPDGRRGHLTVETSAGVLHAALPMPREVGQDLAAHLGAVIEVHRGARKDRTAFRLFLACAATAAGLALAVPDIAPVLWVLAIFIGMLALSRL